MSKAKSHSNGLILYQKGWNTPNKTCLPFEASKIKMYPMAWENLVTGKYAMMVYPTCIRKIHLENGEMLDDLVDIRERLYKLQRRVVDPCYLCTHDWEEGDLVLPRFSVITVSCIPLLDRSRKIKCAFSGNATWVLPGLH
jgi:hypothetical protein